MSGAWINAERMKRELEGKTTEECGQYMAGVLGGFSGDKRPTDQMGILGWESALDGKRYAERTGLDMEESAS